MHTSSETVATLQPKKKTLDIAKVRGKKPTPKPVNQIAKRPYSKREKSKTKVEDNAKPVVSLEIVQNSEQDQQKLPGGCTGVGFQPGQSGNPGGRPKGTSELKKYAREFSFEAIDKMMAIVRDDNASSAARVMAANVILDRGHGKAVQPVEVGTAGAFDAMSDDDLSNFIRQQVGNLRVIDITPSK